MFTAGIILAPSKEHKSYIWSKLGFGFLLSHILFLLFYHVSFKLLSSLSPFMLWSKSFLKHRSPIDPRRSCTHTEKHQESERVHPAVRRYSTLSHVLCNNILPDFSATKGRNTAVKLKWSNPILNETKIITFDKKMQNFCCFVSSLRKKERHYKR